MGEQRLRNLQEWTPWFEEPFARLRGELLRLERSAFMRWHLRSELGVYGLCLAQHRCRIEAEAGIRNQARSDAQTRYDSAMKELMEAYELPDDGSGLIGDLHDWRPGAFLSRADRFETAQRNVVAALIEYAAP